MMKRRAWHPTPRRHHSPAVICVVVPCTGLVAFVVWLDSSLAPSPLPTSQLHGPPSINHAAGVSIGPAPRPVFLDVSSMWAVGGDARTPTQHRTRVPLVTWSDAAVERVARAWRRVQFRGTCDRVLYMTPYQWGITSQMRDYGELLVVSALAFNRTLVLVKHAP